MSLKKPVTQPWVHELSFMQQAVLLSAVRGPDGHTKYGPVKMILRWYRRCLLLSAFDGIVLERPYIIGGGSFTGPSINKTENTINGFTKYNGYATWQDAMNQQMDEYMQVQDGLPLHFQTHFMHAVEIMGYKHPDIHVREWWNYIYHRFVSAWHLNAETEEELDNRLSDGIEAWKSRSDRATLE